MQQAAIHDEASAEKSKEQKRREFIMRKMKQATPVQETLPAGMSTKAYPGGLCMDVIGES